jgi:hypothetical protein
MVIRVALLLFCLLALPLPWMISATTAGNAPWADSGACGPAPCMPQPCPPPSCGSGQSPFPPLCAGILGVCSSICGTIIGCPSALMSCILAPPLPPSSFMRPRQCGPVGCPPPACGPMACPPPTCAPPQCGPAPAPCWQPPAPCMQPQITKCKPIASAPGMAGSYNWYAQPGPMPMMMYPPQAYPAGPMPGFQGGLSDMLGTLFQLPFSMVSGSLNAPGMPTSPSLFAARGGAPSETTFGNYW